MSPYLPLLTILATLIPVAYYIYVGFRQESRPRNLDDYFIYSRKVNAKDFANTSVGYALQMAAVFLFADWGIRYGFGAFWVPIFWGLGFFFLYILVPRFDRFVSGTWTLHGYLYNVFKSRALQVVAAIATIIGLLGTMMVEIDYATTIYKPFFTSEISLYLVGILFLVFALLYTAYGGYKAEVNTERIQVPVAYTAFLVVLLSLVFNVYQRGYSDVFFTLTFLLLLLFVLMIIAKIRIVPGHAFADRQLLIPGFGLLLELVIVAVALYIPSPLSPSPKLPSILVDLPQQLYAQGVVSLLSLFVANAFWQFVDISNWQRLSSVELVSEGSDRYEPLRRGIRRVIIESPVSWGFGVVFGMALRYSGFLLPGDDPSTAIGRFVSALTNGQESIAFLGAYSWFLFLVFVAAVVAIMLSTVTALLSAITFTAFHDLPPFTQDVSLAKARTYTFAIATGGVFGYYALRYVFGVGIQTTLYTFYSSQLALFPTVFASLCGRAISRAAALASILIAILTTFFVAAVIEKIDPSLFLIPPLVTFGVSGVIYLMMIFFQRV